MDKQDELSQLVSRQMLQYIPYYGKILEGDLTLTAPQFYIIQHLAKTDSSTCSELANALGVTLPAVTNLSNKLVKKGYIERIPSETDRRTVYLRITDKGKEAEQVILEKYQELNAGLWEKFSDHEIEVLINAYKKMREHFDSQNK